MSKTIKVIVLLNKIANGEEVPEKIKYANYIFILKKDAYNDIAYYEEMEGRRLFLAILNSTVALNEEVEILEDEETIDIKTLNPEEAYFRDGTELIYKLMYDKINELIFKANKHDKQINKLEER